MMSAEDCRSKANTYRRAAQRTPDPDASLGWLELSDAWLALADQIDQRASVDKPSRRPVELAGQRRNATLKVGDLLRERLALSGLARAENTKASG
jgi:hypothetical protein